MKLETPVFTTTFVKAPLGQLLHVDTTEGRRDGFKVSTGTTLRLLVIAPIECRFNFIEFDDPGSVHVISYPGSVAEVSLAPEDWRFSLPEPEKAANLLVFGGDLFLAVRPNSPSAAGVRHLNLSTGSFDNFPPEAYGSPWVTKWRIVIPQGERDPHVLYAHNWP